MSREYVLQPFRPAIHLRIDYAKELNPQQHAAVTAPPGPALVIAGAGSGKTRTLTYRAAFLLEQGIPPECILLLTFTNKAAREMMRRVTDLLGGELSALWGGTFHAIGARVLRRHARQIGFQPDFSILDREDAEDLLAACLGEMEIDLQATRFPKARVLSDIFSLAANKDESVEAVLRKQFDYFSALAPQIAQVQQHYAARKKAGNSMDFDDLLVLWLKLLRENAAVLEDQQRRFQFILVDEYQDTNKIQGELIDLLGRRHHNIMVVGDDSQSIYSWRGAHFQNILKFPQRYPQAAVYRIETNYRSTPEILRLANAAIAANVHQFAKELTASRRSGVKPVLAPCATSAEQAAFVAQRVLELREEGRALNRMAVLYRSHFHALELQLELTRRNIPFSITSGIRFFEQAHIKDVAAYLKFITNPRDELAFKRIVRLLDGVGGKTADRLWDAFRAQFDAAATPALAAALQKISAAVPKKTAVSWAQLTATVSQLEAPKIRQSAALVIRHVVEAGYEDYLKEEFANYRARLEDLEQLAAFAMQFETVQEFLTQLALLTNIEAEDSEPARRDDEELRLSTVHQAKGLEFDVVFVIMLCDGLFPSARSLETEDGEEEERRLFYVAITRARDELHLSYPLIRSTSSAGEMMQQPSRFLAELPPELLDELHLRLFSAY
ncbi:MAG: UvrD-helicase domain-containing protein [Verrucomicrobiota bacterium]|jgi:DNA helicase-2/ATP-dependent DNA helicase PcrA